MRTTVALDDDLVAQAQQLTGIKEKSRLIVNIPRQSRGL